MGYTYSGLKFRHFNALPRFPSFYNFFRYLLKFTHRVVVYYRITNYLLAHKILIDGDRGATTRGNGANSYVRPGNTITTGKNIFQVCAHSAFIGHYSAPFRKFHAGCHFGIFDKTLLFDGWSIGGLFWLVKKYFASILHRKAGAGDATG